MEATDILKSEHQVILRVIRALETTAEALENGKDVRAGFFLDAADFIKGFADGCHHMKEEGVLFPEMTANGAPQEGSPIGVMLYEHEQGRILTRGMRAAAQKLVDGDVSERRGLIQNALGYVALLQQHIHKEDNILFPMADRVCPPATQEKINEGFEHVEHEETGEGVHENYLALAEKLENEAAAYR